MPCCIKFNTRGYIYVISCVTKVFKYLHELRTEIKCQMCHVIPVHLRNDQLISVCVQGEGKRSSKVVRSGNTDFFNFMSTMVKWKNCVRDRNNFITLLTQNDVRGECIMTSALHPQPGLQQLTRWARCTLPATTSVSSMITVEITVKCFLADFQLCYHT